MPIPTCVGTMGFAPRWDLYKSMYLRVVRPASSEAFASGSCLGQCPKCECLFGKCVALISLALVLWFSPHSGSTNDGPLGAKMGHRSDVVGDF